ncbi:MAG: hypothetical protein M3Z09_13695, partial [Acidobacteriota bacterium]|nr:hypothetical protein [Acidobacteriota bacterium]
LQDSLAAGADLTLKPYDVVTAEKAEMVYVNGMVIRVGQIELGERRSLSVSQALTMAGGLTKDAAPEKARILRPVLDTDRRSEIPIDVRKILAGKANDYPLLPNDLLYIPQSPRRGTWERVALIAVPLLPTLVYLGVR